MSENNRSSSLRIGIESPPNPQVRVFHINRKISDMHILSFTFPINDKADKENLEVIGETGQSIVKRLNEIEGINEIYVKAYGISVEKAPMFDWSSLEPQIVVVLKETLQNQGEEAEVQTLTNESHEFLRKIGEFFDLIESNKNEEKTETE